MKMKLSCCCLTAAAVAGILQSASAADITGKITLKGTPPAEVVIPFDPSCGKLHTEKATTKHYVVGPGGELGDVFVYVKEGAKPAPAPEKTVVLDQVNCLYTPYIFGLQTKQKLLIKNSDPGILHNVHVIPDAKSGNKESNQAQLKGQDLNKTFDKPEVLLHFKCDVHSWMHAYAGVLDHPYFAVSGTDGTFKIANLPPGKYVIEAYHRKAGKQTKEITIADQNQTADFAFEAPAK
ncbi:MAG: carboxypeptidase-like regulatory domain-containing protein [Verrucomicrobiota bacterium]